MIQVNGYQFWEPGGALVALIIFDNRTEDRVYETVYNPTSEEIVRTCAKFDIPGEPVMEMIHNRLPREVHTLFIDVEKYLESLKKE